MIWGFEDRAVDEFLSRAESFALTDACEWPRPSKQIVKVLAEMGFNQITL
jgi:hypothetical protein